MLSNCLRMFQFRSLPTVLLLCASTFGSSLASSTTPVKLLFVGDSITAGICDGSRFTYREPLLQDLRAQGYVIDAIGHRTSTEYPGECYTFPDGDHSSKPGWRADQLAADMRIELKGLESPDIAIIFAGVNDLHIRKSPWIIVESLHNIMNEIWSRNPAAKILLSNVLDNRSWGPDVPGMNVAINRYFSKIPQVTIMDLNSVFILGVDDSDGLHPNKMGAQKLADAIRSVLTSVIEDDREVTEPIDLCANPTASPVAAVKACPNF